VSVRPVAPPSPQVVQGPLPVKAVGFHFGTTVDAAQSACEMSEHRWRSDGDAYRCDGTPVDVGLPSVARLGFCDNKLCDLTASASLPLGSNGDDAFMVLWRALRKQYGVPGIERKNVPSDCKEDFVSCVASDKAGWQAQWRWQSGERIVAKTLSDDGAPQLAVRYIFGAPPQGVDGSAF
jgi:hypothetical protein